jgi:hypothetical protein
MKPTSCFPPNRGPKMRENQQLIFGLRLVSRIFEEFQHLSIQTKIVRHSGGFFHQIKVSQTIGKKDSIQTVIRTIRIHFWYEAAQNFEVFSNMVPIQN